MDRRQFIRVIGRGSGVVLVPSVLSACTKDRGASWLQGWEGPLETETDIRWIVLSYAILAANPHNKQPWLVDLSKPDTIDLYVDQTRLLPETDPPARQIHIGQGTFIENLELAAGSHGYRTDIEYFPQGEYSNAIVENKPVATIRLEEDATVKQDRLFEAILLRQSNKRAYENTLLTDEQLNTLRSIANDTRVKVTTTRDEATRKELVNIMTEAMRIEVSDKDRDLETIAMFRFNDEERRHFRDGFGVKQSGMGGLKSWAAETLFMSRQDTEKDSSTFGEQSVKLTASQCQSAASFGWISTATNTRLDQVLAGRAYERMNLTAALEGIAMHPLSQVLQEYADMRQLQQRFLRTLNIPEGHTVQMLFRLGIAKPVEHSPRRDPRELAL